MDLHWKQFAGLATGSRSNVFLKARLKLTALYVLIVALIIFGFSIFLFQSISHNLRDASDDEFADTGSHEQFVQNTLGLVKEEILLADVVILICSAGVSYVLAGTTLRPIQQSLEVQKAFAANASHELRTPLAVMRNDIEVFMRNTSPTTATAQSTMQSNLEEINRMSGIVENLLVLARSDSNRLPTFTEVDLSALTQAMVAKMQPLAHRKGLTLSAVPTSKLIMRGSNELLERALLNILQNSIDHTSAGGTITAALTVEGRNATLTIADTGSGIPAQDLPHIFTRFYKGESEKGNGLGLSIVKEIVTQHQGTIAMASIEGKGTTATLQLPTC